MDDAQYFELWPQAMSREHCFFGDDPKAPPEIVGRLRKAMDRNIRTARNRQDEKRAKGKPYAEVTITLDECMAILDLQGYRCALTNLQFWYKDSGGRYGPRIPSLDRIEHDGPYAAGNVRIVLLGVNGLRGRGTDAEMYAVAQALLDRRDTQPRDVQT